MKDEDMPNSVKEFKANVWNDKMSKMKVLIKELHLGNITLICNKCPGELRPQAHYDFDDHPHRKQYVCDECHLSDYIIV